jgi:hypothetical protein
LIPIDRLALMDWHLRHTPIVRRSDLDLHLHRFEND